MHTKTPERGQFGPHVIGHGLRGRSCRCDCEWRMVSSKCGFLDLYHLRCQGRFCVHANGDDVSLNGLRDEAFCLSSEGRLRGSDHTPAEG